MKKAGGILAIPFTATEQSIREKVTVVDSVEEDSASLGEPHRSISKARRRNTIVSVDKYTVEPPNNGHIGSRPFVCCREVSLSGRLIQTWFYP